MGGQDFLRAFVTEAHSLLLRRRRRGFAEFARPSFADFLSIKHGEDRVGLLYGHELITHKRQIILAEREPERLQLSAPRLKLFGNSLDYPSGIGCGFPAFGISQCLIGLRHLVVPLARYGADVFLVFGITVQESQ